ncbi:ITGA9 family protein [Megaselia abdita]
MYAEMGQDVKISPNRKEILTGIPGYYDWAGSVIRYQSEMVREPEGQSRRDTDAGAWKQQFATQVVQYKKNLYPFKYDSYFGYSITAGYFDSSNPHKILYLATAPQGDAQSGEAFLFDIAGSGMSAYLDIKKTFKSGQFGEYFGYKVVTEDLNNDNKPDIIISAPMYSFGKHYDVGAVYVFMNQGNMQFTEKIMVSPSKNTGRFGTTISLLGDINKDGFNDIAVGAPFEEDGVVYVFLGDKTGLREKPSQILKGEKSLNKIYGKGNMFGHGISQGSDIDQNGFNDVAIGSPNSEAVFLYKAYPVVEPVIRILSVKEIQGGVAQVDVKICYSIKSPSNQVQSQPLQLNVVADPTLKRATFLDTQSNEVHKKITATRTEVCDTHKMTIKSDVKDIFKPIEVSVSFDIVNKVPQSSSQFCDTCVVSDPDHSKTVSHKISYSTGCAGTCNADLKVMSSGAPAEFIVGQSSSFAVKYIISNSGETAFLPQISLNSTVGYKRVPSNCALKEQIMTCNLLDGVSMRNGQKDEITIMFDTSDLSKLSKIIIIANVTSSGNERTPLDNVVESVITLKKESNIAASGTSDPDKMNLEKYTNTINVKNVFEINNHGPSDIKKAKVTIQIPVAFDSKEIVNKNNISIEAFYKGDLLKTTVTHPTIKLTGEQVNAASFAKINMNGMGYDSDKMGHPLEHDSAPDTEYHQPNLLTRRRRRREVETAGFFTGDNIATKLTHERMIANSMIAGNYPINRTILFTCANPSIECVKVEIEIFSWNVNNNAALQAIIGMPVNLNEINKILVEPFEFFIIESLVSVIGDKKSDTIKVSPNYVLNVISKYQDYKTPWWVILLAVLGGLILLTAITFGMYKAGFFKRNKPPEMQATMGALAPGATTATSSPLLQDEEIPLRDMK